MCAVIVTSVFAGAGSIAEDFASSAAGFFSSAAASFFSPAASSMSMGTSTSSDASVSAALTAAFAAASSLRTSIAGTGMVGFSKPGTAAGIATIATAPSAGFGDESGARSISSPGNDSAIGRMAGVFGASGLAVKVGGFGMPILGGGGGTDARGGGGGADALGGGGGGGFTDPMGGAAAGLSAAPSAIFSGGFAMAGALGIAASTPPKSVDFRADTALGSGAPTFGRTDAGAPSLSFSSAAAGLSATATGFGALGAVRAGRAVPIAGFGAAGAATGAGATAALVASFSTSAEISSALANSSSAIAQMASSISVTELGRLAGSRSSAL